MVSAYIGLGVVFVLVGLALLLFSLATEDKELAQVGFGVVVGAFIWPIALPLVIFYMVLQAFKLAFGKD